MMIRWRLPPRWRWRILYALIAIELFAPVVRYRPSCGDWRNPLYLEGPMREDYAGFMTRAFAEEDFFYIRVGNEIFLRRFYPFHLFNRAPKWDTLDMLLANTEHKVVENVAHGYRPDGSRTVPPPALTAVHAKALALLEEERRRRDEKPGWKPFYIFGYDCELFQAATIRIEDVPPDRLQRFVPKSPLPPNCDFFNVRGWNRKCGRVVRGAPGTS